MSLAVGMIVKGTEWEETKRAIKSVENYVDNFYITTTQKKHHPKHPKVTWSHFDWTDNFAEARNFNFNQIKDKYILWIDSDDVVEGAENLPDVIREMDRQKLDAVFVDYNYEIDKQTGEVIIVHPRERIVRNGVYTWKAALHETLIPSRLVQTRYIKDFVINHLPTETAKDNALERNLRIMGKRYKQERQMVADGQLEEIDPRTEYYLARILFDIKTPESFKRAGELFQDYLQHSGWDEERAMAWNYLGNILYHQKNYQDAISCYHSAIKERPEFPTWYFMLGRSYAAIEDFDKAEFYVKQGLQIEQPNTAMVITPRDDKMNALITLFLVAYKRRDMTKALRLAKKMQALMPNDENTTRVKDTERLVNWSAWLKATTGMIKTLKEQGKTEQIANLIENIPEEIRNTVYMSRLRSEFLPPRVWPEKSVAIFAASDFEPWSPKNMDSGIGGSEEAIIYLAKHWQSMGYEVVVYANVGDMEGEYDGVKYENYHRMNHRDKFDVLIGWRNPQVFRNNLFDARLTLLDLHDVPEPGEFDEDILNHVDYIMVKSEYHRSLLPHVPDNKFKIIGNGIDLAMLKKAKGKNKRYKLFWGSSYDRGLHGLLKVWPQIKREEPLAELHICYGWNLYAQLYAHVPHMMRWKREMEQLMKQDGIVHHGRVGKKELYSIAKDCGIWAYPTTFEEIHCITGAYAQALGCVPVVFNYAALETTVKYGVKVDADVKKEKSMEVYVKELVKMVKDKDRQEEIRKTMNVDEYSWENVAKQWVNVFNLFKTQDTKVSIITPTIRTGFWNLMAHNLSSQTYQNFEWIIIDDHKDNREDIATKYAKKYGIKIIYKRGKPNNKRNYGLSSANNIGWKAASGDLWVRLDDFVLLPQDGLERLVDLHRRWPDALIAPVDEYRKMKVKPKVGEEDWFDGETDVAGDFIRQNIRIGLGELRFSDNPYDFELNFGAIPMRVLDRLNGFWEFYDEGLGYDNTEIALRAMETGSPLIIDERLRAVCLDLWEHIGGTQENGEGREHNLNDPLFEYMVELMQQGKITTKRDKKIDDKLDVSYEIPRELDQDGAVEWMKERIEDIVRSFHERNNIGNI